jgi:hypothetical protein
MKNVDIPTKPEKGDIIKELEWRQLWKDYNDRFEGIQADHKIRLLLKWFKEDFFEWVNSPKCSICKVYILQYPKYRVKQITSESARQRKMKRAIQPVA